MINVSDVATGLLGLGVIAGAVGLVAIGGRDPRADEHTVADYPPALAPARRAWPLVDRQDVRRRLRARATADLMLPPVAADPAVGLPLYAETVVADVVRTRYGTTDRAEIARRMLREIAVEQQAEAGIHPSGHAWQLDGSCWAGCPACAQELTGAFPVVAVAA